MRNLTDALESIRRLPLAALPTPLTRLTRLEAEWGYERIYCKRDDMTGLGPGGNKIRSLEFLLGEALAQNADTILVAGPLQSNLCTLAACACAKLGLRCITVHNGDRPERTEGNLLLNRLLETEAHYVGPVDSAMRNAYADELRRSLTREGKRPYLIENGGTSGMGALGYVAFCVELLEQTRELGIPIRSVFATGGNGGVATGLVYGNALLGCPFEINIVSVESSREELEQDILRTIGQVERVLGLDFNCKLKEVCNLIDEYRGEGWGVNTAESEEMVRRFPQMEGIFIENVYTSKVLVGMEAWIRENRVQGDACYLHTGGFGSLFAQY